MRCRDYGSHSTVATADFNATGILPTLATSTSDVLPIQQNSSVMLAASRLAIHVYLRSFTTRLTHLTQHHNNSLISQTL